MPRNLGQPIGPFPARVGDDDEARSSYDRERRRVLWSMPAGLYVIGSRDGARRNLMTANLVVQLATEPKLVGVAVEREAVTHALVSGGRCFGLSFLAREDRAIVRRFAKPAADDGVDGELAGAAVRTAATGAPLLACAVAWLDCELRQEVDLGSHTLFVGEVVDAAFEGEDVPLLRMEDTRMSYGG
ncbi:MAG: flavin reductase family protein [Acidimicrobiales bacterium]